MLTMRRERSMVQRDKLGRIVHSKPPASAAQAYSALRI